MGTEVDDAAWLPMTGNGFTMPCADPIADLITRHHLLRLVSGRDTPARRVLAEEMRGVIQEQIDQHGLDAGQFLQIDRMTKFCDFVAFDRELARRKPQGFSPGGPVRPAPWLGRRAFPRL